MDQTARREQMRKEISEAKKPTPLQVKAEYLMKQWLDGEQSRLESELRSGVTTIVGLLMRDLNDASVPDPNEKAPRTVLEQNPERTVVRYNVGGYPSGIGSEPVNFTPAVSNAMVYGKKRKQAAAD